MGWAKQNRQTKMRRSPRKYRSDPRYIDTGTAVALIPILFHELLEVDQKWEIGKGDDSIVLSFCGSGRTTNTGKNKLELAWAYIYLRKCYMDR